MLQDVFVLLVEDDEDDMVLLKAYLNESHYFNFIIDWETDVDKAKAKLEAKGVDICLIDYRLGKVTGLEIIEYARKKNILKPIILLTGQGDTTVDLEAMRQGAADYLLKNQLDAQTLERSIRYALSHAKVIRELEDKEKQYRYLFERSIDPIFIIDEEFNFVDVNESMLTLFKCSEEKVNSMRLRDLFASGDDFTHFKTVINEKHQVKNFEVVLQTCHGGKLYCMINCVFIPEFTTIACCYQGIIHDLTMRKKAERELVMAEKLLMSGKIARTIAHEVRNPLTNLNLALEQLKEELPSNDEAELYTGIISRNANRIEQLISEMLNSSKPSELHLELVPLPELLEETFILVRDRVNLNKMKLIRQISDDLPRIYIDREKMKIALLNIMINAIEAMTPEKGVLTVATSRKDHTITISIKDNGKGIDDADLDKLFDPFYTAKHGGMGLGLTTTQNILNSHNIGIEIESRLGEGTTFYVVVNLPD